MTAYDLILSSLKLVGIIAAGETPSVDETNDALLILNQMIDSWNTERMMIFTLTISEFPLTVGQQTYTLRPGENFNISRPARIERMGIVSLNNPAQPLELPLAMLTDQEWANVTVKIISSSLPQYVYDDGAYPLRNLSFWCIPNVPVNVRIYGWTALSQFANLQTDLTFPPGYFRALRYNLAVDMAAEFGAPVRPEVAAIAAQSKAAIKSINAPSLNTHCEAAVAGNGKSIYNWLTDTPASRG